MGMFLIDVVILPATCSTVLLEMQKRKIIRGGRHLQFIRGKNSLAMRYYLQSNIISKHYFFSLS